MNNALLLGFALGFVTASPIGPMGLLCLRRTLTRGVTTGLISALGISCAYAFWSYVAIHGLAAVSHWIEEEKLILEIVIGLFFFLYGVNGIFNEPDTRYPALQRRGGLGEFLSTFLVVFLNPATFVMFSALFALFGLAKSHTGQLQSLEMALSVFAGSMVFWIVIIRLVHRTRDGLQESVYRSISHLSSYAITLFAIAILFHSMNDYWMTI